MASKFQKATGGKFITLKEASATDKVMYLGERVVGKFLGWDEGKLSRNYNIHLYADMDDEDNFGNEPDGQQVILGGSTVIDGAFDKNSIQAGAIVEIIYKGKKEGANAEYDVYEVGFFYPKNVFKKATPAKDEESDEEEGDDESEEEEEKPVKAPVKKPAVKKAPAKEEESDESEDDDLGL